MAEVISNCYHSNSTTTVWDISPKLCGLKKLVCARIDICMLLRCKSGEDAVGTWGFKQINDYQMLFPLGVYATGHGADD